MKARQLLVLLVLAWSPYLMAAAVDWTSAFEATPANSDQTSQGDDRIRELKETIRDHAEVEHRWGPGAPDSTGRHREGSAVVWYESSCPTSNTVGDAITGTATYGSNDAGRWCKDSDDGINYIWEGSAWDEAIESLSGTINLLNTPLFTKNGADGFDIHAHDARHRLGGSDGAWTDAADGMPFAIQQILTDTSVDGTACSVVPTADFSGGTPQTFGEAGDACLSVSTGLNFTGRTGNSRLLVIATASVNRISNACSAKMGIFLDNMSTQLGDTVYESVQDFDGGAGNLAIVGYTAAVDATAHEIAVHLSDADDDSCDIVGGELIIVDLGNST